MFSSNHYFEGSFYGYFAPTPILKAHFMDILLQLLVQGLILWIFCFISYFEGSFYGYLVVVPIHTVLQFQVPLLIPVKSLLESFLYFYSSKFPLLFLVHWAEYNSTSPFQSVFGCTSPLLVLSSSMNPYLQPRRAPIGP